MTDAPASVAELVAQLTLEEKAALTLGSDFWHTAGVERLGIPAIMVSDGPHGLRKQPEEADHVGIGGSVPATCFPTAATLGSSWDVDLVREVGVALGTEAAAEEVAVLLGPGINIKRSPLCGRNFEYFSEDPHVSAVLGAALVEGMQSTGTGACVKHYAANNQETDRVRVSADVDERTLREIYLAAFEHIVKTADPWTVMCSYNKINGTYASQNHWLLTEVLRDEWGYSGLVMSDWGAVADRVPALAAGLDLEMPPNLGVSNAEVVAAVKSGELDEAVLDRTVTRLLELVQRARAQQHLASFDKAAHHRLAARAAAESAVLLKNDGILPLQPAAGSTLAVIGEFARTPRYQGAGSSQVNPTKVDAALPALQKAVPEGVDVIFAAGFGVDSTDDDEALGDEAMYAAQRADAVVCFLGLPASAESEGFDRTHIDLPANQIALLRRVTAANSRVAVVLSNGSAVATSGWEDSVSAILDCWLTGQAGGGAVADLLLGAVNPSGHLSETIPVRLGDNPASLNFPGEAGHVRYGEGVFVGYRGCDAAERPVSYPFGHGLSYTTFDFANLAISRAGSVDSGDLRITVSFDVSNTGSVTGKTVAQVYVRDPQSSVARPPRELRAFRKVELGPGQTERVRVQLGARDLSYWSPLTGDWALEGGEFVVEVGASSRDIRVSETLTVDAPRVAAPLTADSTLEEWFADPVAGPALRKRLPANASVLNPELLAVIGNFPVSRMAAMHGLGVTREAIDAALADIRD
jgi:beta-glucosidase